MLKWVKTERFAIDGIRFVVRRCEKGRKIDDFMSYGGGQTSLVISHLEPS